MVNKKERIQYLKKIGAPKGVRVNGRGDTYELYYGAMRYISTARFGVFQHSSGRPWFTFSEAEDFIKARKL